MEQQYCEIFIEAVPELQEILVAELAESGYDGFEESAEGLKAYINAVDFDEILLNQLLRKYNLTFLKSIINKQNWNQVWESNFEPVRVDDFVGVRADFHPPYTDVRHDIVITPKMSFGTGHHATTWMVMKLMGELDFSNRSVFDFGTGTGILAILAEKLGARKVFAVDNDPWCIENASENILINKCNNIDIHLNEKLHLTNKYDIILANINRNIILDNLSELVNALHTGAQILFSGLLESDEKEIGAACEKAGLDHHKTLTGNGWIALWFVRK